MPIGRPKGSGSPFFCQACQVTTLVKKTHLKSVAHRQNRRIRALLQQPCITFSEVGRRLGVTRERVRQIADRFCSETGRQRQHACTINKGRNILPPNCLALKAEEVCQERGLPFQFVPVQIKDSERFSRSVAIVANEKCALRRSSARKNGNIVVRKPGPKAKDAKFLLSPMPDGRWLVIPKSKWPHISTEFKPGRREKLGGKSKRHDWPEYIDAWHLLKNPQLP